MISSQTIRQINRRSYSNNLLIHNYHLQTVLELRSYWYSPRCSHSALVRTNTQKKIPQKNQTPYRTLNQDKAKSRKKILKTTQKIQNSEQPPPRRKRTIQNNNQRKPHNRTSQRIRRPLGKTESKKIPAGKTRHRLQNALSATAKNSESGLKGTHFSLIKEHRTAIRFIYSPINSDLKWALAATTFAAKTPP